MGIAMPDFAARREAMVQRQIAGRGIRDPLILHAFLAVPREEFVLEDQRRNAYGDHPLPIEAGQTISQPYIVAMMIAAAEIRHGDKVLEVGAGSGYAAAVMSRIARKVIAIERHGELAQLAAGRMRRLNYDNVRILHGDGSGGCVGEAPFDAILAAATGSHVPETLVSQLARGGRIVMPIGEPGGIQELVKVTKQEDGCVRQSDLGAVRFVPLIGEEGWSDDRD
jgi:protein-L-isoaspartate(D-aspartate) O-methyltransferase